MLLKIFQLGEAVLREEAQRLTKAQLQSPETQQLIDLMVETLRRRPGVGIAAPQVGESLQIIVVEDKPEYQKPLPKRVLKAQRRQPVPLTVFINPVLHVLKPGPVPYFEGCLSVDGYRAVVPRAEAVRIEAWDRLGKPFSLEAEGWLARILQHETDHLKGRLFPDIMAPRTMVSEEIYKKEWLAASPAKIKRFIKSGAAK